MVTSEPLTRIRTASGITLLLGVLWIALSWVLGYISSDSGATHSGIAVGALIVICAFVRVAHPRSSFAWSIANILFGVWTLISPSIFGFDTQTLGWLGLAVGTAVIASAARSANVIVGPTSGQHA